MPQPGDVLGDRYRLDSRIAAGGMGEVWRATDTVLGRDVAVKTLHADRAGDPGFQTRFRHEARAMALLHHPGVADVYDYGQTGADAYIVMARVEGEALNQRIAERGRLTPIETMSIVTQAGHALQAAHEAGIVHRDVKPGNLIIRPDGTVVLVDFGVARSAESAALTGAKEVVGTALYIAPEQVSKQTTGPLADVYALGAVAYHCMSGRPPFLGENPIAVAMQHLHDEPPPLPAGVPEPVRVLVATAMAKDPADRFSSAAAMADAAETAGQLLSGSFAAGTTAILAGDGLAGDTGPGDTGPGTGARRTGPTGAAAGLAGAAGLAAGASWNPASGAAGPGGAGPVNGNDPLSGGPIGGGAVGGGTVGGARPGSGGGGAGAGRTPYATGSAAVGGRPAGSGGVGSGTAVMPAVPGGGPGYDDNGPGGGGPGGPGPGGTGPGGAAGPNRRRTILLLALALLVLAGIVGTLAWVNFGTGGGGGTPAPTTAPANSVAPSHSTTKGSGNGTTRPSRSRPNHTTTAPGNSGGPTTKPTAGATTTPATEPTTAPATEPTTKKPTDTPTGGATTDDGAGGGATPVS